MTEKQQEIIDTLLAISVVSKRLAKNLMKAAMKQEADSKADKQEESTAAPQTAED